MTELEAMRTCCRFITNNKEIPARVKEAIDIVLQSLGDMQKHYSPGRPIVFGGEFCCPYCKKSVESRKNKIVRCICGKPIDWRNYG